MKKFFLLLSILFVLEPSLFAQTANQKKQDETRPQYTVASMGTLLKKYPDGTVRVEGITKESPSEQAGLQKGDIFVSVDRNNINVPLDLVSYLQSKKRPGDRVEFVISRKGERKVIPVTLGARAIDQDVYIFLQLLKQAKAVRLAVLMGEINNTEIAEKLKLEQWQKGVKVQLLTEEEGRLLNLFGSEPNFALIDRNQVEAVLEELKFGSSGLVSEKARNELGELLGLTHMYIVEFSRFPSMDLRSIRIIDVKTGKVLNSYSYRTYR